MDRKVDKQVWKYAEEDYPMSVNFGRRLRTGQTIQTAEVVALDVRGEDVTSELIEPTPQVTSPLVAFSWKAGGGTAGQRYYVSVVALTQDDTLKYHLELEVR